jgi:hypothetical protein
MPELILSPEIAFAIVQKARAFDVKVDQTDPDSGSNPSDDGGVDTLEFGPDDDVLREMGTVIHDLNDDEQRDLIALIWLGRGDFSLDEWEEARTAAADLGRQRVPRYVAGIPLVSTYLEDGLSCFNLTADTWAGSNPLTE